MPASHETLYLHVYADKAKGGKLYENMRAKRKSKKAMQVGMIAELRHTIDAR